MNPTPIQDEYVEKVGRWWEQVGSRTAGRILGWLMICEPPHRSAPQLANELKVSAGSISTQTTTLERIGFIERVTFPGDRASYYQLRPNVWVELMQSDEGRIEQLMSLADAASDILPTARPDRVTDLGRVASFFLKEWPGLMTRLSEYMDMDTETVK